MASLLIATPRVHSTALRSSGMIADVRGFHGQETSRIASRRASVSAARAEASDSAGRQAAVTVRQSLSSPLLNLSPADLIAAFSEEKREQTEALQQSGQVSQAQQVERRRSERVIFTEEKARRLRKENRATMTFHDKWYHSAIASRLATPE